MRGRCIFLEQPSLGPHQSFRGINAANLCMEKLFALCHSRRGEGLATWPSTTKKGWGTRPHPLSKQFYRSRAVFPFEYREFLVARARKRFWFPFERNSTIRRLYRENNLPLSPHCRNFSTMGAANSAIKTFVRIGSYHDVPTTLLGVFSPPSQVKTYTVTSDRRNSVHRPFQRSK